MSDFNLKKAKHIHFVGIKGVGVSGLALIAKHRGFKVTGSDVEESFISDEALKKAKIPVEKFSAQNIKGVDLIIHSVAYNETNPEIAAAKKKKIPLFTYPQALGLFMQNYTGIGVTGAHGKTTTSALISYILVRARMDPNFIVGAPIPQLGSNSRYGKSKLFVVEADDYRYAFLNYARSLKYTVITNIDWDHPDCYPSLKRMIEVYAEFVTSLPKKSLLLVYGEDKNIKRLLKQIKRKDLKIRTYGFNKTNDYVILKVAEKENQTRFSISTQNCSLGNFEISIPGEHNVLNSTAAIIICQELGLSADKIAKPLKEFKGAKRRFEIKEEKNGVLVIDDYAHHPAEIKATLKAARKFYPQRKIWAVFQPHTFSRTKALLSEFAKAFRDADSVVICDIFASAREKDTGEVSATHLAKLAQKHHPCVKYIGSTQKVVEFLKKNTKPKDIVITLGAGDVYKTVGEEFLFS
ncbi:UDP-N-acetylmuramate--L-alanine ligase [bacterium]|nr:UDP-N-acetylmuramate--L-alanine ligase [bacterium]